VFSGDVHVEEGDELGDKSALVP